MLRIQGHILILSPWYSKQAPVRQQTMPRQRVTVAKLSPLSFPLPMLGQVAVEQQVIAGQEAIVVIAVTEFEGYL